MAHEFGHFGFGDSFLSEILGDNPVAAFQSFDNRFGGSNRSRDFFNSMQEDIFREFEGGVGRSLRRGELPTQSLTEFLSTPGFFTRRLLGVSPERRGDFSSRLITPSLSFQSNVR
jgi:hypothetical protein